MLLVPASESAPHGITRNDAYAWPIRDGTSARWMREPELAARYRDRFAGDRRSIDRVDTAWREGLERLDRGQRGWLAVTAAPTRPGRLPLQRDAVQRPRAWLEGTAQRLPTNALLGSDAAVGRRRVVHSNVAYCAGPSTDRRLELHTDGAGFAAIALADVQTLRPGPNMAPCALLAVRAIAVEKWTLALLGLLAEHAVRAGAGGDLVVRAQLIGCSGDQLAQHPLAITEFRDPPEVVLGQPLVEAPRPTETTVSTSVATDPTDLIAAAAGVAGDLLAEFAVPVPRVPDGQLDPTADRDLDVAVLTGWAERLGRTSPPWR